MEVMEHRSEIQHRMLQQFKKAFFKKIFLEPRRCVQLQSVNQEMFSFRTHLKRCWRERSFRAFHSFISDSDMRETSVTTLLALPGKLWHVYLIFLMRFPKDAVE